MELRNASTNGLLADGPIPFSSSSLSSSSSSSSYVIITHLNWTLLLHDIDDLNIFNFFYIFFMYGPTDKPSTRISLSEL